MRLMRVTFLTVALVAVAACSLERSSAPASQALNPQRSALRMCTPVGEYPANRRCESPMLIVDGRTVDFDSANLDPHDIEAIEIVRGDSAVVRFGEAARKGVVIVTSKKALTRRD